MPGLLHQRQLGAVGNGGTHGHEQRRRQRDQLQHQHADHHLQRIARQPVALRRHHHNARDHQAQQRSQQGVADQDGRRLQVHVARQPPARGAVVAGR
ncbi:hypothetical protein SDC9_152789 [bioreactor metagenome]|uniref:Uncharacterized protein n=1 Tax=bioreactor metagenome TaxID=1076179 RepID=A0A645EU17_9ZZZZ